MTVGDLDSAAGRESANAGGREHALAIRQVTLLPVPSARPGLARRLGLRMAESLRHPATMVSVAAMAAVATKVALPRLLDQQLVEDMLGKAGRASTEVVRVTETWSMTRTVETTRRTF